MKVYSQISNPDIFQKTVISIGSFDGVHTGHQKIFKTMKEKSKNTQKTIAITFFPTPQSILNPNNFKGHLNSKEEKIDKVKELGVDILYILKFDDKIKKMTAKNFLKIIIRKFNPELFIVGYNHCFGYKKEGDSDFLKKYKKKYNYKVVDIPELKSSNKIKISSTTIRNLIANNDISNANNLLGYNYSIQGVIVDGDGLGRKIGFPTANIKVSKNKLIPGNGVYFINAHIDRREFQGMVNIGIKPTVSKKKELSIEAHLFNFNEKIYGMKIIINFIKFIRNERDFKSIDFLKKQLEKDRNKCLEYSINNV